MVRFAALTLLLSLPFVAMGQSVGGDQAYQSQLLSQSPMLSAKPGAAPQVPLWRDTEGHVLSLSTDRQSEADALRQRTPLALNPAEGTAVSTTGLQYLLAPNVQAHADISEHSAIGPSSRILGSEVGATYVAGRYSVGVSVGSNSTPDNNNLPRVLPGTAPGADGLYSFDSSDHLNANGRLALGSSSGIDLGASVGRIHLTPGNELGVSALDQKALSFGVDHGSLSGVVTGRTMAPQAGIPGNLSADRRWNSIDLGVTWRLPWSGSLSVGAQNLFSSGTPANTPVGPEPDQSRTPYVQYHQDL